ncbi:sialic acid TRAP transporter substrate-binding protein SiaP [Puniceibacterium sediminis]|uniref:Tripartite ATP-independent transporter solute receptor, DctP family n=1 Tax=Puniceibacterium sediminis TaxID=1608407 RepID=A0A238ZCB5_9RHOB|nr:sialic acid TRAP transporter substrate-binding protein SiaP [Puniceibacterium sediminis]SNR81166.1 tripartite ATP-independent transporter solute receptor, DctP family [Puniceibacterium sediminis]
MKSLHTIALAAIAGLGLTLSAAAQDKTPLIFSDVNQPDVPRSQAVVDIFAKEIGGDFDFQPYFGATLMKQGTELIGIQRGNIQMAGLPPSDLAQQAPEFDILGAAYVVRDQKHLKSIFASPVGDHFRQIAHDQLGVVILGTFYYGTRQVNLKGDKEIKTPADMAGVKLRMPGGESWQFLGKALGANPVPIAYSELYTALQTGVVDGQDNPLPNDKAMKFYEVTDQIVMTSHNVGFGMLLISAKVWDAMTPEQQTTMQAAADKATAWSDEQYLEQEHDLVEFFKGEGLKVYEPDLKAFQDHAQKLYLDSPLSASWPQGMLEEINKL